VRRLDPKTQASLWVEVSPRRCFQQQNRFQETALLCFACWKLYPPPSWQELTREMRQFESIFVLQKERSQTVRAWVFTMEEELDFAGHPVLGAAAALHEETMAGIRKVSWTFELNKKSFPVQTIRQESHYRAEMDQGVCIFALLFPLRKASHFSKH